MRETLPIGGVVSERVCACSLCSRLVSIMKHRTHPTFIFNISDQAGNHWWKLSYSPARQTDLGKVAVGMIAARGNFKTMHKFTKKKITKLCVYLFYSTEFWTFWKLCSKNYHKAMRNVDYICWFVYVRLVSFSVKSKICSFLVIYCNLSFQVYLPKGYKKKRKKFLWTFWD